MTVAVSNDRAYFRSVLERPGIRRAAAGGLPEIEMEAALNDPRVLFVEVQDKGERLGFVAFRRIDPAVAEVHSALLTLGSRTLSALKSAFQLVAADGVKLFVAIIPLQAKAVILAAHRLGFKPAPELKQFYPEAIRPRFGFYELAWR